MQTHFTSLLSIKKNQMKKSELALIQANINLNSAKERVEESYKELSQLEQPQRGSASQIISSKMVLQAQRSIIQNNKEWLEFAMKQVDLATQQLKKDTLEFEKFTYLENEEIKKILLQQKKAESKNLDEIAIMRYKGIKI